MRLATCLLIASSLASGCATGYGTLAAAGAGAALGTIGTAVSASKGESVDGMYIVEGAAAGALFGVIAAAVAASVGRKEGRQQAANEAEKDSLAKSSESRIRALEEELSERRAAESSQRSQQN